jgi:hypothetical protein
MMWLSVDDLDVEIEAFAVFAALAVDQLCR